MKQINRTLKVSVSFHFTAVADIDGNDKPLSIRLEYLSGELAMTLTYVRFITHIAQCCDELKVSGDECINAFDVVFAFSFFARTKAAFILRMATISILDSVKTS